MLWDTQRDSSGELEVETAPRVQICDVFEVVSIALGDEVTDCGP